MASRWGQGWGHFSSAAVSTLEGPSLSPWGVPAAKTTKPCTPRARPTATCSPAPLACGLLPCIYRRGVEALGGGSGWGWTGAPTLLQLGGTWRGPVLPLELLSQHCVASHVSRCLFLVFRGCNHFLEATVFFAGSRGSHTSWSSTRSRSPRIPAPRAHCTLHVVSAGTGRMVRGRAMGAE